PPRPSWPSSSAANSATASTPRSWRRRSAEPPQQGGRAGIVRRALEFEAEDAGRLLHPARPGVEHGEIVARLPEGGIEAQRRLVVRHRLALAARDAGQPVGQVEMR